MRNHRAIEPSRILGRVLIRESEWGAIGLNIGPIDQVCGGLNDKHAARDAFATNAELSRHTVRAHQAERGRAQAEESLGRIHRQPGHWTDRTWNIGIRSSDLIRDLKNKRSRPGEREIVAAVMRGK